MSLRARFVVAACLVTVVLGLVVAVLPGAIERSQLEQVDKRLTEIVPVAVAVVTDRLRLPEAAVDGNGPAVLSDLYAARVSGSQRSAVVRPAALGDREPVVPGVISVLDGRRLRPVTVGSAEGSGSWRAALVPFGDGSSLLVAFPLDQVVASTRSTTVAVLVAVGVVLLTLLLAGWWLFRLGLRPIADVTGVADAIAAGQRGRRAHVRGDRTEASRLATAFNVMVDEHDAIEARLRRFIADASHELRTPLTAISGFADLWRHGSVDVSSMDDVMRRIGQESARMSGLVDDLLLLAALDGGRRPGGETVDLVQLANDAILDASASHPSRTVRLVAPDQLLLVGDEAQLRQVITNLLSNALIHTDHLASVTIRLSERADTVVMSVIDGGPGMSRADVGHAFDRFWRGDAARARRGSGLGLSLVRSIVEAHGGRVELDSSPGGGTVAQVVLPRGVARDRTDAVDDPRRSESAGGAQETRNVP